MRIIAFVTDRPAIHSILSSLGEPTAPPEACPGPRSGVAPARGPPLWEQAAQLHWDDIPAPAPEYVFDQRVSWYASRTFRSEFVAGPGPGLTVTCCRGGRRTASAGAYPAPVGSPSAVAERPEALFPPAQAHPTPSIELSRGV
jgi:hypothetical protein